MSDHKILEIRLTAPPSETQCNVEESSEPMQHRLNYFKADFPSINKELIEVNWTELLDGKCVADQYGVFLHTVNEISRKYTPQLKMNTKTYRSKFYRKRRALMRKRRKVLTAINMCKNPGHKENLQQKFDNIESQIKSSHEAEKTHDETEAVKKISKNTKYFYAYARKNQKCKDRVGPLRDKSTSEIISDDTQIANKLQQQFCSVFSKSTGENKIQDAKTFFNSYDHQQPHISDIQFLKGDIVRSISELKSNSAPGLDGFSALVLKKCAEALSTPLYTIFRQSLDTGEVPNLLKDAIIVPIHKGGLKSQPQNYRPINLISHVLKVLEKIIRNELVYYLETQNLMNPNQHAFRKH